MLSQAWRSTRCVASPANNQHHLYNKPLYCARMTGASMAALPATRGHADGADTVSHSVQQSGGSTEIKHDMSKPASHLPFSEGPVVPELAGAAMGGAVGARLVLGAGAMAGAPALVAGAVVGGALGALGGDLLIGGASSADFDLDSDRELKVDMDADRVVQLLREAKRIKPLGKRGKPSSPSPATSSKEDA